MGRTTVAALVAVSAVIAACGGGGGSTSPSGGGGSGGGGGTTSANATVTIAAGGVISPRQVEIPVGGTVMFVNNNTRTHEMSSDPHPEHTNCPPINNVSAIRPGESKVTGSFPAARSCGFHDHGDPTNPNLAGTIVIR